MQIQEIDNGMGPQDWREIFMKQSADKYRYINVYNLCVMVLLRLLVEKTFIWFWGEI